MPGSYYQRVAFGRQGMVRHFVKVWLTMFTVVGTVIGGTVIGVVLLPTTAGHAAERSQPAGMPSGKPAPRKPMPANKEGGQATEAIPTDNSSASKAAGELAADDSSNGKSAGKKKIDKNKKKNNPKGMQDAKPGAAKRPAGTGNAGTWAGGQINAGSGNGIKGET